MMSIITSKSAIGRAYMYISAGVHDPSVNPDLDPPVSCTLRRQIEMLSV